MDAAEDRDAGWTPTESATLAERLELDDLDLLREVTHPVRGAVLRRLKTPRTVAELATIMGTPVTRLYHHVNKLADLGLIHVVATRQVAAVTERRYQVTARSFSLDTRLFETSDLAEISMALGSLFDLAKIGLQRSIEAGLRFEADDRRSAISLGEIHLSDERHRQLIERLNSVVADFTSDLDDDDPAANHVTLFVSAFPDDS
ncbi:MAG: helix-turn-helix domain-containing protein [Ilumatobacter sp.]